MAEPKSKNIVWHHATITKEDREKLFSQKGVVIWFTGLSGSGEVEAALFERGCHTYILDGDNIRHGLNKDIGFSPKDREENIRRIGEVAHLFAQAGVIVMTAFISPYLADREMARKLNKEGEFIEIYCRCALEECERRDTKGLYKKARAGEVKEFTGISAPYEEPAQPELILDTDKESLKESAGKVLAYLEKQGIIAPV
ncbi:MAG: adenylyl-sulfate kinase [Proteobacteria bacterium]|nr:adenylyl-sulfate kinase [Pseudomonadota bacterium]